MLETKAFVLSQYRMTKARNAVSAAQLLYDNELYGESVVSSYHAVLYSIKALAAIENVSCQKDTGYLLFLYSFYINTGKIETIYAAIAKELFLTMQQTRELDFFLISKSDSAKLQHNAFRFVRHIQDFLKEDYDG